MSATISKAALIAVALAVAAGCGTDNHVLGVGGALDAAGDGGGGLDGGADSGGRDAAQPPADADRPPADAGADGAPRDGSPPPSDAAAAQCTDEDGDGYGEGTDCLGPDCDDQDRAAHPGAEERCNGIDDDCDGMPDACPCSPGLQNCPEGEQCTLDEDGEQALACVPVGEEQIVAEGEVCERGTCAAALRCILRSGEEEPRCMRLCDPARNVGCSEGEECLSRVQGQRDVGLCRPPPAPCDIYTQDCPDGQACTPYERAWGERDFRCIDEGPNDTGEPCGADAGGCRRGHICVAFPDRGSLCQVICQDDDVCPDGESCRGSTLNFQVRFCL